MSATKGLSALPRPLLLFPKRIGVFETLGRVLIDFATLEFIYAYEDIRGWDRGMKV